MDRLSYLYLLEDMFRGIAIATEVALKPKVRASCDVHGALQMLSSRGHATADWSCAPRCDGAGYHELSL